MAVTLGVKKVVPQILQYYRRHGANTSSWLTSRTEKVSSFDLLVRYYKDGDPRPHAVRRLEQLLQLKERLNNCPDILLMSPFMSGRIENALLKISAERKAVDTRLRLLALPRWRRWFSLVRFCYSGQYTYFSGKKSLIKDLILR